MAKHRDPQDRNAENTNHQGKHGERHSTDDPTNPGSYWVDSPERRDRGVGDRQTGGRDD